MNVDYYSLLRNAVAGKDTAARDKIYNDAWGLIQKSSSLTREAASSHAAALEDAIRRIEDELATDETKSVAEINEVLSTNRKQKPLIISASAVVVVVALSALLYGYVAKGPTRAGLMASSSRAPRGRDDAVVADLKPGVDGGSSGEGLPFAFQRQVVFYRTTVVPGSIVIDRQNRFLYLIDSNNWHGATASVLLRSVKRAAASSVSPASLSGLTGRLQ